MTGFGRGSCQNDGREITIEIRSVNHRFLDLSFRVPRSLSHLEDSLRQLIKDGFSRGHMDITLTYKNTRQDARQAVIDEGLAYAYIAAAAKLQPAGVSPMTAGDVLRMPDVVRVDEAEEDADAVMALLIQAYGAAEAQLRSARLAEGERTRADLSERLTRIECLRQAVEAREPLVAAEYKDKLTARIAQLLDAPAVDEARLALEIAIFADKASVTEELERLRGHIAAMLEAMKPDKPVGRKLDFIVQEMNREANTIGSKAQDAEIGRIVVELKTEIERIREQVQNIE